MRISRHPALHCSAVSPFPGSSPLPVLSQASVIGLDPPGAAMATAAPGPAPASLAATPASPPPPAADGGEGEGEGDAPVPLLDLSSSSSRLELAVPGSTPITLQTGTVGRQAAGAVLLTCGETVIYSTVCYDPVPKAGVGGGTPLMVNYG